MFDIDKMYIELPEFIINRIIDWRKVIKDVRNKFPHITKNELNIIRDEIINGLINFSENTNEMLVYDLINDNPDIYYKINFKLLDEGRSGRNNRIFDIQWAMLTNRDTMIKIFNPGGFDNLKKVSRIINILKSTDKYSYKLLSLKSLEELDALESSKNIVYLSTLNEFFRNNMTAAKLIGIMANNNTSHGFISLLDIYLNVDKDFTIDNITVSDNKNNKLDSLIDFDGNLISKTIASYLASSVDAVKDPVLNYLNLNTMTTGVAMVLIRLGFNTDVVSLFMTLPILEKLSDIYFTRNNEGYISILTIIDEQIQTLEDKLGILSLGIDISKSLFTKENLAKSISQKNTDDIFQLEVLLLFKKLSDIAVHLNTLTFITKFNSISNSVGPTIADNLVIELRVHSFMLLMEEKPPFRGAIDIIKNSPILEAFYNSSFGDNSITKKIFSRYFPHYTELFKSVINELNYNIKGSLNAKTINLVVNDLMAYKLTIGENPIFNTDYDSRNSLIRNFVLEFTRKKEGTDNILMLSITVEPANTNIPVLSLLLNTAGISTDKREALKNSWADLVKQDNNLGINLLNYNFLRNGFSFSPRSFINLANSRVKYAKEGYIQAMNDISYNNSLVDTTEFLDLFFRNHSNNRKLVPVIDSLLNNKKVFIKKLDRLLQISSKDSKNLSSLVLNSSFYEVNYVPFIIYKNALYKISEEQPGNNIIYYHLVDKLGVPNNFLEYSGNEINPLSVFKKLNSTTQEEQNGNTNLDKEPLVNELAELTILDTDPLIVEILSNIFNNDNTTILSILLESGKSRLLKFVDKFYQVSQLYNSELSRKDIISNIEDIIKNIKVCL